MCNFEIILTDLSNIFLIFKEIWDFINYDFSSRPLGCTDWGDIIECVSKVTSSGIGKN